MKKYKLYIEGKNILIDIDDQVGKHGFFTTRFIKAQDTKDAEKIALQLIRDELKSVVLNGRSDPPTFLFQEINEIDSFGDYLVPGAGFTWFDSE